MPRFNGTGPQGFGPGTGWSMGPCGMGMGWRRGFGRGFGRFWKFGSQIPKKDERGMLEEEAGFLEDNMKDLEEELKAIKARLAELR